MGSGLSVKPTQFSQRVLKHEQVLVKRIPGGGGTLPTPTPLEVPHVAFRKETKEEETPSDKKGNFSGRPPSNVDCNDREAGENNEKYSSRDSSRSSQQASIAQKEESRLNIDSDTRAIEGDAYTRVLPRGGHWLKLGATAIQFGVPPETIKDSMQLGLDIPRFFVVFGDLFSRTRGINFAELEFPAYFNFFIRKQRTVVVTTLAIERRIRALFQETLLGPSELDLQLLENDFAEGTPHDRFPDFKSEGEWLDPGRKTLSVDSLIEFRTFQGAERDSRGVPQIYFSDILDDITLEFRRSDRKYRVRSPIHLGKQQHLEVSLSEVIQCMEEKAGAGPSSSSKSPDSHLPEIPIFGVTMLGTSHGFDANGQTTGFVLWAHRRGTMIDPPQNAIECLDKLNVSSRVIDSVILTHCHSDHDAGAFRRLLLDQHITIYTTPTIFRSFVRKYTAVTGFSEAFLKQLLKFKPVRIGEPIWIHGAKMDFYYSLHTIPCIGFSAEIDGKTISYSADTHNSMDMFKTMFEKNIIRKGRLKDLKSFKWQSDLVLHEAGVPPIHTPITELLSLDESVKENLYVVHVAEKDIPKNGGLQTLSQGETKIVPVRSNEIEIAVEVLDVLSTIELFSAACETFRDSVEIMYLIKCEEFEPGECIVKAGDPGDKCYIIIKGSAKVTWETDGVESFKFFRVGDYFGESSLVTGEPRNANVHALGHVRAATLSREHFEVLIRGTDVKPKLQRLAEIRAKGSWGLIMRNSVARNLTSTAKTTLEFAMEERTFKAGELVCKVGEPAEFVMLVKSGTFSFEADIMRVRERKINLGVIMGKSGKLEMVCSSTNPTSEQETNEERLCSTVSIKKFNFDVDDIDSATRKGTVTQGAFIGDFDAVCSNEVSALRVTCEEEGTALVIPSERWRQFCGRFPGGLIFFLGKHVTT